MLVFLRFEKTGILDLRRLHAVIVRMVLKIAVFIYRIYSVEKYCSVRVRG